MVLRDYLMNNIGKRVKIGAERGSSFIFADTITENTIGKIQQMSDKQYKKITDNLERLTQKNAELEEFAEQADKLREWSAKFIASGDMRDATKQYTAKYKGVARVTKDQLQRANTIVRLWEPYLDRKIVEKYKAINEYQTMIVMVTGVETGNYWTIAEYRKKKEGGEEDGHTGNESMGD